MSCVCGNSLEIKLYIGKHLQKKHLIFFGSKFKISTFQTSFKNAKPQEMTNESSISIPPKKS